MQIEPWKRVEPTVVTKSDWRTIVVKTFEVPGKDKKLTIATFDPEGMRAALVIALTKDKQVVIARQFRHGPEKIMDDLPGGAVDPGEEPEAAAHRELLEETGYTAGAMEFLGTAGKGAYNNGTWYYYLATDCEPAQQTAHGEEEEQIEVRLISIFELIQNAKQDRMTDPAAVLMAYDMLVELSEGQS